MITNRKFKDKVTVRFVKRDGGGLQAFCDVVPGFYLSGGDPRAVMRDVVPAIEMLMEHNVGIEVKVWPLRAGDYQMVERDENEPADIPEERDYLVDLIGAAA